MAHVLHACQNITLTQHQEPVPHAPPTAQTVQPAMLALTVFLATQLEPMGSANHVLPIVNTVRQSILAKYVQVDSM